MSVMIEAKNLTKLYGQVTALADVSFKVKKGEVLGFLGPNGAGKTTTMKILTCFIAPTTGTAKVNGCDVFQDPMGVRKSLGYLPESNPLYHEMLVAEFLEWVARMRGLVGEPASKRLRKVVEETAIGDVIGKEIRTLSKGYRQRVGLAQALVHEPPILILDEPMSGLDPNQTVEIRELIKEIGKERTVIFSTHNMAEAEKTCDRLLVITNGKIVADDTAEGLRRAAGNGRYQATFPPIVDKDKVREALLKIPGVASVESIPAPRGEVRFAIVPRDKTADLREAIFRAAVDAGVTLLDLAGEFENLERRFHELTVGADSGGKQKKAKTKAEVEAERKAKEKAAEEDDEDEDEDDDEDDDDDDEAEDKASDEDGDDEDGDDDDEDEKEEEPAAAKPDTAKPAAAPSDAAKADAKPDAAKEETESEKKEDPKKAEEPATAGEKT